MVVAFRLGWFEYYNIKYHTYIFGSICDWFVGAEKFLARTCKRILFLLILKYSASKKNSAVIMYATRAINPFAANLSKTISQM